MHQLTFCYIYFIEIHKHTPLNNLRFSSLYYVFYISPLLTYVFNRMLLSSVTLQDCSQKI